MGGVGATVTVHVRRNKQELKVEMKIFAEREKNKLTLDVDALDDEGIERRISPAA